MGRVELNLVCSQLTNGHSFQFKRSISSILSTGWKNKEKCWKIFFVLSDALNSEHFAFIASIHSRSFQSLSLFSPIIFSLKSLLLSLQEKFYPRRRKEDLVQRE